MRIEHVILKALIYNETYSRKVLPFIDDQYLSQFKERFLYKTFYLNDKTLFKSYIFFNSYNFENKEIKKDLFNLILPKFKNIIYL